MKLLLDEGLSERIIHRIIDLYPDSDHVKPLALTNADDEIIFEYAKARHFAVVSKDIGLYQSSVVCGHSSKFIHLQIGNSSTSKNIQILRSSFDLIIQFGTNETERILVLV